MKKIEEPVMVEKNVPVKEAFNPKSFIIENIDIRMSLDILLVLIVFVVIYLNHRLKTYKNGLNKKIRPVEKMIRKNFDSIKNEIMERITNMHEVSGDKSTLQGELSFLKKIKKSIDATEKDIFDKFDDMQN